MIAKVDDGLCIGCGQCEQLCPAVFMLVEGISRVQLSPVPEHAEDCAREAMEMCPTGAISLDF